MGPHGEAEEAVIQAFVVPALPDEDILRQEQLLQVSCVLPLSRDPEEKEIDGTGINRKARQRFQFPCQPFPFCFYKGPGPVDVVPVPGSLGHIELGRAIHIPGNQGIVQFPCHLRICEGAADAEPRHRIELRQGHHDHQVRIFPALLAVGAGIAGEVDERFVNHHEALRFLRPVHDALEFLPVEEPAIGVIRISQVNQGMGTHFFFDFPEGKVEMVLHRKKEAHHFCPRCFGGEPVFAECRRRHQHPGGLCDAKEGIHEFRRPVAQGNGVFIHAIGLRQRFFHIPFFHVRVPEGLHFPITCKSLSSGGRKAKGIDIDAEIEDFIPFFRGKTEYVSPVSRAFQSHSYHTFCIPCPGL